MRSSLSWESCWIMCFSKSRNLILYFTDSIYILHIQRERGEGTISHGWLVEVINAYKVTVMGCRQQHVVFWIQSKYDYDVFTWDSNTVQVLRNLFSTPHPKDFDKMYYPNSHCIEASHISSRWNALPNNFYRIRLHEGNAYFPPC